MEEIVIMRERGIDGELLLGTKYLLGFRYGGKGGE